MTGDYVMTVDIQQYKFNAFVFFYWQYFNGTEFNSIQNFIDSSFFFQLGEKRAKVPRDL